MEWIGGSRLAVKAFPDEARNIVGNQLWLVQLGRQPDDSKAIREIGPGAMELRIHRPHEHRVVFVAKFPEAIYVIHAFQKTSQKTSSQDLRRARAGYVKMQELRKARERV